MSSPDSKSTEGTGLVYTYIHKKDAKVVKVAEGNHSPEPDTGPDVQYTLTYDRDEKGGCLSILGYLCVLWVYFHILAVFLRFFL